MYDINFKNLKKGKNFFALFFIVGTLFVVMALRVLNLNSISINKFNSTVTSVYVSVKSYVNSDGQNMYTPIYHYEVNGVRYSCDSHYSSNIYPSTQNMTVYYNSSNPSDCMIERSKNLNYFIIISMILPIISVAIGLSNIRKINKRIKLIKLLNENGKLVKNLPYRLEKTGIKINKAKIKRPVVDYVLPSGDSITLYGDPRYDKKLWDFDGLVDLVIDENNVDNYYIDFNINRLTGNLPQDYSDQSQNKQSNDVC